MDRGICMSLISARIRPACPYALTGPVAAPPPRVAANSQSPSSWKPVRLSLISSWRRDVAPTNWNPRDWMGRKVMASASFTLSRQTVAFVASTTRTPLVLPAGMVTAGSSTVRKLGAEMKTGCAVPTVHTGVSA
jgi:hypothetical protein